MRLSVAFILTISICLVQQIQARSYVAAVAEYAPIGDVYTESPSNVLKKNLLNYGQLITEASAQNADIIVFPEYGIMTLDISSLTRLKACPFLQQLPPLLSAASASDCQRPSEAADNQLVFTFLSCYARQYAVYVAANLGEILPCSPGQNVTKIGVCPEDGAFQFNTNAVFDREGRLLGRYRKTHLFLEPPFESPIVPDHVVVSTDFGVDFGLLTCFDIVYYEPAQTLYRDMGITDFIFPTAWVDELPFLTAVQVQEGTARSMGINLLASGYHLPAFGQLGSGVYGPSGPMNYTFSPDSGTQLIVARVPKKDEQQQDIFTNDLSVDWPYQDNFSQQVRWLEPHGLLFENLTGYSSLELTDESSSVELCHDEFCCNISYQFQCSNGNCDRYRLFSYSGVRYTGGGAYLMGIQLCGIVSCTNGSLDSCAQSNAMPADILNVQLSANFRAIMVFPTAIDNSLKLLSQGLMQYRNDGRQLSLREAKNVLSLGLYGRLYEKDA